MPVTHKKINAKRGQNALARLREEMKKTADAIREEEQFSQDTARKPMDQSELANRYPALRGVQ
ncbi:hypothetical protein ACFWC6_33355 [Micromonospora chalcea]